MPCQPPHCHSVRRHRRNPRQHILWLLPLALKATAMPTHTGHRTQVHCSHRPLSVVLWPPPSGWEQAEPGLPVQPRSVPQDTEASQYLSGLEVLQSTAEFLLSETPEKEQEVGSLSSSAQDSLNAGCRCSGSRGCGRLAVRVTSAEAALAPSLCPS